MAYNKEKQFNLLKKLGKEGLLMHHYELHEAEPSYTSDEWRTLLKDPEVTLYIQQEFNMIRDAEVRKLQAKASDNERSVGAAQLINAMTSVAEKAAGKKEGPTFIYTFVPPSPEQMKAHNVRTIDYLEAQKLELQPKEIPLTLEEATILPPKGDARWTEK